MPRQDLKYVRVVKERDGHGNPKKVVTRMVYGDPVEVGASLAGHIGLQGHNHFIGGEAEPFSEELWKEVREEDHMLQQGWGVFEVVPGGTTSVVQLHKGQQKPQGKEFGWLVHSQDARNGTGLGR